MKGLLEKAGLRVKTKALRRKDGLDLSGSNISALTELKSDEVSALEPKNTRK